jgi:hypothetical protein
MQLWRFAWRIAYTSYCADHFPNIPSLYGLCSNTMYVGRVIKPPIAAKYHNHIAAHVESARKHHLAVRCRNDRCAFLGENFDALKFLLTSPRIMSE